MLTYNNHDYYTKYEVIKILTLQKSENSGYKKHIYNIIISKVHNSKEKFYKVSSGSDIFLFFKQTLVKEIESEYKHFFLKTN